MKGPVPSWLKVVADATVEVATIEDELGTGGFWTTTGGVSFRRTSCSLRRLKPIDHGWF